MSELLGNSEELELTKIRLERTVDAAYHALLEMSAWMGIPESKRQAHIQEHMSNVIFCAKNNLPDDPVVYQNAIKSNVVKNDSGVDHGKDERVPYIDEEHLYRMYLDQRQANERNMKEKFEFKSELDRVKALLDEAVELMTKRYQIAPGEWLVREKKLLKKLKGGV